MKKFQIILSLLLAMVVLSSCHTSKSSFKKLNNIQRGMSADEVIDILGKPKFRNFNDKGESLEFYYYRIWSGTKVVKIWFVNDKVVKMSSRYDTGNDNCIKKIKTTEDDKEDTSSGIRITTDGHQLIKQGSFITTPEGTTEIVVSDHGGLIITASGKHIRTH